LFGKPVTLAPSDRFRFVFVFPGVQLRKTYVNQFPRCDLRRNNLGVAAVADVAVAPAIAGDVAGSMGLLQQRFSLPPDIMCRFARIALLVALCILAIFAHIFTQNYVILATAMSPVHQRK